VQKEDMIFGKPMKMMEIEVKNFCHCGFEPFGFRPIFGTLRFASAFQNRVGGASRPRPPTPPYVL
jgi:hypothetical protein